MTIRISQSTTWHPCLPPPGYWTAQTERDASCTWWTHNNVPRTTHCTPWISPSPSLSSNSIDLSVYRCNWMWSPATLNTPLFTSQFYLEEVVILAQPLADVGVIHHVHKGISGLLFICLIHPAPIIVYYKAVPPQDRDQDVDDGGYQ